MLERVNGKESAARQPKKRIEHLPGQVILRVRRSPLLRYLGGPGRSPTSALARKLPEHLSGPIDFLRNNAGLKVARPMFQSSAPSTSKARVSPALAQRLAVLASVSHGDNGLAGFSVLSLDPKSVTQELMHTLGSSPMIEIAELMPARWTMAAEADPMRNLQWGLRAVRWFEATRPTAADVRVAVLDTGIDVNHPGLNDIEIDYRHEGPFLPRYPRARDARRGCDRSGDQQRRRYFGFGRLPLRRLEDLRRPADTGWFLCGRRAILSGAQRSPYL